MDSERKMALDWWRRLSTVHKAQLANKHYGNLPFGMVASSSSKIEMMYRWEHEDKDDT